MADRIRPFISAAHRVDVLGQMVREHSDRISAEVAALIERGLDEAISKKDGKDGAKDSGETGLWDKKDGKDGGAKDGSKDGSKDGDKDGAKDGDKDGAKDGSKDASDKGKDTSDKGDDKGGDKDSAGGENVIIRHGDELVLPADAFTLIAEVHSVRLAALLNQPIF
ncbi:hypothetical protein [Microbispora sp. H10830]|uniref:hypothetical protein n=1 Tax=Microbispora sp. H10830 TaxID=2729109 RepID=UPI0016030633|nr:hypothetical protein [Microbispora sp. H10830]